ncbi:hypothetical protein JZ751_023071 [Albula glossodonta]|uniref:G-protein coupled receptors family 1 profile domain-containing protein n=1 Tax=Albula glossodonta TaxID=121402 RepID=A0A8T2PHZ4_9TELE|nr:hypothetical protein JZ751_023071 [Albula glossodonta]
MEYIANCYRDQRTTQKRTGEWKKVAKVMDRFFMWIFFIMQSDSQAGTPQAVYTNLRKMRLAIYKIDQSMNTSQQISEFIIVGLSEFRDKKTILFAIFLLGYMTILGGNIMIIYLVRTDSKLRSPMYFFLHNLSFVDIIYTSTTIPNMLAWGFGMACTLPSISLTSRLPFCGPNLVRHCFCDPSSVMRLACTDITINSRVSLAFAAVALLTTLILILSSYATIGASIARMSTWESRGKAFATCTAHLTVVSISYGSAAFVYISYRVGKFSPDVRIVVAILYSCLTPLLNPFIYSLRNKELRDAVRRTFCRHPGISPQGQKMIATLA